MIPKLRLLAIFSALTTTLLGACQSNSSQTPSGSIDTTIVTTTNESGNPRSKRIAALGLLRKQIEDTTGTAFSDAFRFPIAEASFYPYVEQESFGGAYEKSGYKLTKDLFLQYFPEIDRSLELSEFRELLAHQIPISLLEKSDSLHAIKRTPNEACHRYYILQMRGDELMVQYGSDHDSSAGETEDDEGIVCEWATLWTFRFDGSAWRFANMQQAG